MNIGVLNRNSNYIFKTFLSYLPSRFLVVLNSLIILPVLAHLLSTHELTLFQLSIGLLNLVCTCSSDWIAKSVLRFYERYKANDNLGVFFYNVIVISLIVYLIIALIFLLGSGYIAAKFLIPKPVLFITLVMLIPAGFRQFLYQMLRVFNKPYLYTFSILFYQIALLALFLMLTNVIPNVYAVLYAMMISLICIDIYVFREINLREKLSMHLDYEIMKESLIYALPQILTNTSIWAIFHVNQYVFQYLKLFDSTSVVAIACMLGSNWLSPIFSAFIFAILPTVIRRYEYKDSVSNFMLNVLQLYCILFIPLLGIFCYYSNYIVDYALAGKYPLAIYSIPAYAVVIFFHEFMKLFNIKYHLQNKTYIEMAVTIIVGFVSILLTIYLISKYDLAGANIAILVSMLALFFSNILVKFHGRDFVKYSLVLKTFLLCALIGVISFAFVHVLFLPINFVWIGAIKIMLFVFISYLFSYIFIKKLIND